ncbi:MAG: O-methyltransferase [Clostridia bacterium]|nr:O-methyltransferase [Clostridia bacterium]
MSFYEYGQTEEYLLQLLNNGQPPGVEEVKAQAEKFGAPIVSDTGAQLLKALTLALRPNRILEIGTAIGYSGLIMLLNSQAHLYTVDFDEVALEKARRNFKKYGVSDRVRILSGDASDVIPMIEGEFDMIFLDGPKGRYYEFLPYLINLLPKGGLLLCDNVLYSERMSGGREVPKSKKTIADRLAIFMRDVTSSPKLVTSILPVGDGMSLSIKV